MRIAGIVAEYNPFHNGHLHHLRETRLACRCDAVVAVMSGNFTQRGEPAAFDKWARSRMALACGVDAVFELPAFYALQSADWFAYGGVAALNGLGCDCLSFGSELPDIAALSTLTDAWEDEPEELKQEIHRRMKSGKPHPKARAEALEAWLGESAAAEALKQPNAVLGAMYLSALKKLSSAMEPVAVPRIGAAYNDETIRGTLASATAVRRALFEGGDWREAVPESAATVIDGEMAKGTGPVLPLQLGEMLLYALRTGRALPDLAEGLGNRMRKAAYATGSLDAFYIAAKSKRYTMARIKRAAMQALLGISAEDIHMMKSEKPVHARLLGYSRRANGLINELARRASIPFVARAAEYRPASPAAARLWEIDLAASDVYALACPNSELRKGKRDFTEKMIIV